MAIHQGDILKIDGISHPALVASKDFFNTSGEIIACPIISDGEPGPLHIFIDADNLKGYVQCEKLALLDMNIRHYSKCGSIHMRDLMNITDAIQGIFDYI